MQTDKECYEIFQARPEAMTHLTGESYEDYRFDSLTIKNLEFRLDGVLYPPNDTEPISVVEFQGYSSANIYSRLITEVGLLGLQTGRTVYGILVFLDQAEDPHTAPWAAIAESTLPGLRKIFLDEVLEKLQQIDPENPLLAVFTPYRIKDPSTLINAIPAALNRLQTADLDEYTRTAWLNAFRSWTILRLADHPQREQIMMKLYPLRKSIAGTPLAEVLKEWNQSELLKILVDDGTITQQQYKDKLHQLGLHPYDEPPPGYVPDESATHFTDSEQPILTGTPKPRG